MANHRRFFIDANQITGGDAVIRGETARQIARVLRLREGSAIALLDGSGREYDAELTFVSAEEARCRLKATRHCNTESNLNLSLAMCLPKGDRTDLVVQKCTELGISRIIVVESERTIARLDEPSRKSRLVRWRKIATEAAEQSGRSTVPEVAGVLPYTDLPEIVRNCDLALVAWEGERLASLRSALRDYDGAGPIILIVGPEGGLTESEVNEVVISGAKCVSLGRRNLRSETAAIAGCAAIMFELEGEL